MDAQTTPTLACAGKVNNMSYNLQHWRELSDAQAAAIRKGRQQLQENLQVALTAASARYCFAELPPHFLSTWSMHSCREVLFIAQDADGMLFGYDQPPRLEWCKQTQSCQWMPAECGAAPVLIGTARLPKCAHDLHICFGRQYLERFYRNLRIVFGAEEQE